MHATAYRCVPLEAFLQGASISAEARALQASIDALEASLSELARSRESVPLSLRKQLRADIHAAEEALAAAGPGAGAERVLLQGLKWRLRSLATQVELFSG
jgi:hypothetical protein